MRATIRIKNVGNLQATIARTEAAVSELKDCLWELSKLGVEVELNDEDKAASGN